MSNIKKHADVVSSMEEFTLNYDNGMYVEPWVVYVGNNNDGYSVIYSNNEKDSHASATPDVIDSLKKRLTQLEDERVYCYEEEYDILIEQGSGWVTNIDGTRSEVVFDNNKLYCIYEDEGPVVEEPNEPEQPTPDEPVEPETPENGNEPTEPESGESNADEPTEPTDPDLNEPENNEGEEPTVPDGGDEPTPENPENGDEPTEPESGEGNGDEPTEPESDEGNGDEPTEPEGGDIDPTEPVEPTEPEVNE